MVVGSIVNLRENSSIDDLMFSKIAEENWKIPDNPVGMDGVIIQIGNKKIPALPVIVLWSNGLQNSYDYCNLIEIV